MKLNYLFLMLLALTLVVACGDEEPMDSCDSTDMTYTDDIASIFNASCALSGCHAEASTATFEMHDYATAKVAADGGKIVGAITHTTGFAPMPYPEPSVKIDSCNIVKITQWIADGAPE